MCLYYALIDDFYALCRYAGATRVERTLGLNVLRRKSKKPKGFDELIDWFNNGSLSAEKIAPYELCMVGDRLLTDVLFGNVHGMLTIHVQPLTKVGDNRIGATIRSLETAFLLPLARRAGAKPPQSCLLNKGSHTGDDFLL